MPPPPPPPPSPPPPSSSSPLALLPPPLLLLLAASSLVPPAASSSAAFAPPPLGSRAAASALPPPLRESTSSTAPLADPSNPLLPDGASDATAGGDRGGDDDDDDGGGIIFDEELIALPRHPSLDGVNRILAKTESVLRGLHVRSIRVQDRMEEDRIVREESANGSGGGVVGTSADDDEDEEGGAEGGRVMDRVFANSYVDLGRVDTVGFDYDYTLVTYRSELLDLIYDMSLNRLVKERHYPAEMLTAGLRFDPMFSIRGLAVDRETGWICHLSYTHKVAVAWEGRSKVESSRLMEEYTGKRALRPAERKKRLKPLNDLFSMAECCLIADTVQFFLDSGIPFCPRQTANDVLSSIGQTHISGDFHRLVAADPGRYFNDSPHLKTVLERLKDSGKRLIFVSNSPFWYVDAGMRYVIGDGWRDMWDAVVVSAGKPAFYTDDARPFREVSATTGRIKFKKIERLEPGEVYTEGCLRELTKCLDWNREPSDGGKVGYSAGEQNLGAASNLASPNVLYIGDSLFADLVDAKREFGWTTAAVTPEVGYEMEVQGRTRFVLAQRTIDVLLNCLRRVQSELGTALHTPEDAAVLDGLERLVSLRRDEQTYLLGNPFGSVFRARFQPSLFAHSLRRYCDLYMPGVSCLRHYSPQHRFYPSDARLLSHEVRGEEIECWDLDDVLRDAEEVP